MEGWVILTFSRKPSWLEDRFLPSIFAHCIRATILAIVKVISVEKLILMLGFAGQALFGARTVAQWIYSEREGRVVSPAIFWIFSTIGSILFLTYGMIRSDIVIIIGQTISFYIYVRNLQLKGVWSAVPVALQFLILIAPPLVVSAFLLFAGFTFESLFVSTNPGIFLTIGMTGQLLLNFRYFYQWYHSEKAGTSILPLGFWIISAVASILVVIYALNRWDPVLLVAQAGGLIAYLRNIFIHVKQSGTNGE